MSKERGGPDPSGPRIETGPLLSGRIEYGTSGLTEDELAETWLDQFTSWYAYAVEAGIPEPNAVVLATVDPHGMPAARLVLMKSFDGAGIVIFTNGDSAKGHDLAVHPRAALVFPWHPMHRQVRLSGPVELVHEALSDAYFASRPYGARIAARVSRQSKVIGSRTELEAAWAEQARAYPESSEVPRPAGWQGYRVRPEMVEFWSGRENRLHDRLRFRRTENGWVTERLAP